MAPAMVEGATLQDETLKEMQAPYARPLHRVPRSPSPMLRMEEDQGAASRRAP